MSQRPTSSLFDPGLIIPAIGESFKKLDPRVQWRSPVMFVVLLGAGWTSAITILHFSSFNLQISLWLWFTLGWRLRNKLRAAEHEGRVLHMEDLFGAGDNQ